MFELNQLRCFIAVADQLNFRRAAKLLNMTQPPLSRQIQLLEHEIGAKLLDRTSRSVRLTAAGTLFLPEAQHLLNRAEHAALTARRAQRGQEGAIQVGFIPASAFDFLPQVLAASTKRAPGINLMLREMMTIDQVQALKSGQIELGLTRMPRDSQQLATALVSREPFILAVPKDHPLASKDELTLEDFNDERYIMYSPAEGRYGYEIIAGLFSSTAITPDFIQYVGQTHTILALVNAGIGMSLVPAFTKKMGFDNVTFRDMDLPDSIVAELYLLWRDNNDNPIAKTIRDTIIEIHDSSGIG